MLLIVLLVSNLLRQPEDVHFVREAIVNKGLKLFKFGTVINQSVNSRLTLVYIRLITCKSQTLSMS